MWLRKRKMMDAAPDDAGNDGGKGGGNDDNAGNATLDDAGKSTDSIKLSDIVETHTKSYDGFDPSIHATNEDGTPRLKADGTYAKKRGRKGGATSAASALPPKNAKPQAVVGEPGDDSTRIAIDEAARMSANLVINAAVWTLGSDVGKPRDKAEADGLRMSFTNYYEARGVPNIPPEIGLLVALGSYIGPRLYDERSMTKIEKVKLWIAAKLHK